MASPSPEALQQQISALEQQLAATRTEAGGDTSAPYERAEVHAAVGEHITQAVPTYQTTAPVSSASGSDVPSWQDPAIAGAVQGLVNVAFTQSIQAAIAEAAKTGNPALMDALHDVLADELYRELLNRQKVIPAP